MSATLHLTQGNVRIAQAAPFELECGGTLEGASLRYAQYGDLNDEGDNVYLVCHALSGSSRVDQWWPGLLDTIFDLERDCVICFNVLGSCYGSTGPSSINPQTGRPYGSSFPRVTVRDWVRAQKLALEELGVTHLRGVIGASIGGMQALQWGVDFPEWVDRVVAIGTAHLSAVGLGLNHLQREAIRRDPNWLGGDYYEGVGPREGLAAARALAMVTYKSAELFDERHGRRPDRKGLSPWEHEDGKFDIAGYLEYQGRSFVDRFDANSYLSITKAMDLFDPQRDWHGDAWKRVTAQTLLVGISSDILFPASDVRKLARDLRNDGVECRYEEITSSHGHDSFLAEPEKLAGILRDFLQQASEQLACSFASTCSLGDSSRA